MSNGVASMKRGLSGLTPEQERQQQRRRLIRDVGLTPRSATHCAKYGMEGNPNLQKPRQKCLRCPDCGEKMST